MSKLASVQIIVHGRVQGVYFRVFTLGQARELGLTGHVRNLPGGKAVEVQAEGERQNLERLVDRLRDGPTGAKIENVETSWSEHMGSYSGFSIVH